MGNIDVPIDPSLLHIELSRLPQIPSVPQEWLELSLLHLALTQHPQIYPATKLWSSKPEPGSHNYSRFLHQIPLEIRNMIYEFLLVNPLLGGVAAVNPSEDYGARVAYNLHPAILAVNHQIHDEASDILYTSNRFIVDTYQSPGNDEGPDFFVTPLSRHLNQFKVPDLPPDVFLRGMRRIRDWKVIVGTTGNPSHAPFGNLCRLLALQTARSLEICILPPGIHWDPDSNNYLYYQPHVSQHLSILRNVSNASFRDAKIEELSGYSVMWHSWDTVEPILAHFEPRELEQLIYLATGDSPVELVSEMYNSLYGYAKLFEPYAPFQIDMDFGDHPPSVPARYGKEYAKFKKSKWSNPFKNSDRGPHPHPVEQAMRLAYNDIDTRDITTFKTQRNLVLQYLEPQYQRMSAASTTLMHSIHEVRRSSGLFDRASGSNTFTSYHRNKCAETLILLEDYARTFERDMPLEVRKIMRTERCHYENLYSSLPVPNELHSLNRAYEEENGECFVETFKKCLALVDVDFKAILEARKTLFGWDITDRCCGIDFDITHCADWIDWEANETDLTLIQYC